MPRFLELIQEIPVTLALTGLNLVMFFVVWSHDPLFQHQTLIRFGAHYNPLIWEGQYYRLLTCALLHGGLWHLVLNGLALFSLGELLEHVMGSRYFFLLYLLAVITGNVFSLLFMSPVSVGVGASGGIMGLAGALSILLLFDRRQRFIETTYFGRMFFFGLVALNFAIGEWFHVINNAAHLGGFLAGLVVGLFFWSRIPGEKLSRPIGNGILAAGLLVLIGMTGYGLTSQDKGNLSFYKSIRAFRQNKLPQALSHLKTASKDSNDPYVLMYQTQVSLQQKKWKEAKPLLEKLVKLQGKNVNHWASLILTLTHLGETKKADVLLSKAEKRFGMGRRSAIVLANLMAARHREREAIALYQSLLERSPRDPELHNNLAWLLVTAVHRKFRNPTLALYHIRRAMELYPRKTAAFLDTYATVLMALKKYPKAVRILKSAMTAPDSLLLLPYLHLQLKEARRHLPARKPKVRKKATQKRVKPLKPKKNPAKARSAPTPRPTSR